jgi:hypothetical protein
MRSENNLRSLQAIKEKFHKVHFDKHAKERRQQSASGGMLLERMNEGAVRLESQQKLSARRDMFAAKQRMRSERRRLECRENDTERERKIDTGGDGERNMYGNQYPNNNAGLASAHRLPPHFPAKRLPS